MTVDVLERAFEEAIGCALLEHGRDEGAGVAREGLAASPWGARAGRKGVIYTYPINI